MARVVDPHVEVGADGLVDVGDGHPGGDDEERADRHEDKVEREERVEGTAGKRVPHVVEQVGKVTQCDERRALLHHRNVARPQQRVDVVAHAVDRPPLPEDGSGHVQDGAHHLWRADEARPRENVQAELVANREVRPVVAHQGLEDLDVVVRHDRVQHRVAPQRLRNPMQLAVGAALVLLAVPESARPGISEGREPRLGLGLVHLRVEKVLGDRAGAEAGSHAADTARMVDVWRLVEELAAGVRAHKVRTCGQVKSSQVKSSQVKSSQVRSSQVKSSQVKSSQVKSSLT